MDHQSPGSTSASATGMPDVAVYFTTAWNHCS